MAQTIKIKRSTTTAVPSSLTAGELAYSDNSDKLFIAGGWSWPLWGIYHDGVVK